MKKIISLFKRNYDGDRQVYNEVTPGAEWVLAGEGVATVKIDGTSCMIRDGKLYRRYDAKAGRTPPAGWEPAQEPDPVTGHHPGWLLVGDEPESKYHREAFGSPDGWKDGTYELIGEKVQGNPYNLTGHSLILHGLWRFNDDPPRDFEGLRAWLGSHDDEGIVWHRDNGDMVKIKRRDFGLKWGK